MAWSADDVVFMQRAIEVAEKGRGNVRPNPLVGCVLVKEGEIIAEGWHDHLGGLHAEHMAIHDAEENGHNTNGSIAYVTSSHVITLDVHLHVLRLYFGQELPRS